MIFFFLHEIKDYKHIDEFNVFTSSLLKLYRNVVAEQVIIEMTDGGADYCFECVGMASLMHEAYASCRKVCVTLFKL
jgi:Zn-dependent alcohol dehydrogenase